MAITKLTKRSDELLDTAAGDLTFDVVDVTFDSSYPTGGEAITAADLGFTSVLGIVHLYAKSSASFSAQRSVYDPVGGKLKLESAAGVEATNASDQSAYVATVLVIGLKGTV
jgi:hypothetical protein